MWDGYGVLEGKAEALRGGGFPMTGRGQSISRWGQAQGSMRVLGATAHIPSRVVFPIYLCASIPEISTSHAITGFYHSIVRASQHTV
jgi:hypothetical protein